MNYSPVEAALQKAIAESLNKLFGLHTVETEIKMLPTRKEFEGNFTYTTFPVAKTLGKSPEAVGEELGSYLLINYGNLMAKYNVVKGFLNLSVSDSLLLSTSADYLSLSNPENMPRKGIKVMVEFSSPNTNKPLHLGHLRNNFLGDSVARILKAAGYEVVKANLVNDRGIHICKSMLAYQKYGNGETPVNSGIKGDHLVGKYYVEFDKKLKEIAAELAANGRSEADIEKQNPLLLEAQEMLRKWEAGDTEIISLWKKMNEWVYSGFNETYQKLGIAFDKIYYESDTYLLGKKVVDEGLQKRVFYKKADGSVWIDLTQEGLDEKLVLRADGTSVYITQDIGTADLKYQDFAIDKSVYVVGNEQDYHFVVLKHIMKKLGRPYAEGIYHLSYGMVDLPSGKMKSREGTVVDADDLIQEMIDTAEQTTRELGKIDDFASDEAKSLYQMLGLGALKYYLLKVDPKKRMLFNPQESIDFHGHTGPFIQYTHARICAILRKADKEGIAYTTFNRVENYTLANVEKELIIHLLAYTKTIYQAAEEYSPAVVAQYVFDLAKLYNSFYAELSIFQEKSVQVVAFRVALSNYVAIVIRSAMNLLGVQCPQRM